MAAPTLAVRLSLSFGLFVVAATAALLIVFQSQARLAEEQRLASLADANVAFLERSPLPQSEEMAAQLGTVIGAQVLFSHRDWRDSWIGKSSATLHSELSPLTVGEVHRLKSVDQLATVRELRNGARVAFLCPSTAGSTMLKQPQTWAALSIIWLLSLALATWWAQRLARPLQRLTQLLPQVGQQAPLPPLPHADQTGEIGELARALSSTHTALTDERERRRAAERLALLGRMATSLAHELRNPLAAIRLHTQLMEGASAEEAASSRGLIESELARMDRLVQQWLHFARPAAPKSSAVDMPAVMQKAAAIMLPQASHARVTLSVEPTVPTTVQADSERLLQVLLNLILNAIQAMPEGGNLSLSLQRSPTVQLVIQDSGPGFSGAALQRGGEPFFSEKEGGMGLGLSVAKEVMTAMGGSLTLGNQNGGRVTLSFV
jgi:signal transduction histidine kinase